MSYQVIREIRDCGKMENPPYIVAILAHADDLEANAGGTFAKYLAHGYRGVYGVLSLCNSGYTNEDGKHHLYLPSKEVVPRRMAEAKAAADVFGAELFQLDLMENMYTDSQGNTIPLDYPRPDVELEPPPQGGLPLASAAGTGCVTRYPSREDAVDLVAEVLIRCKPELVIGQCVDNRNPDHFAAALIVYKAYQKATREVEMGPYYIGMVGYDFFPGDPDLVVDVSGYEDTVNRALACHISQGGHVYARYGGESSKRRKYWGAKIGTRSAEAFMRIL